VKYGEVISGLFQLRNPYLDNDPFKNLQVHKAVGPLYYLNRIVKHCLERALTFLSQLLILYHFLQLNRITLYKL